MADQIKRVGIIRGGTGDFYQVSIKEGAELISRILERLSEHFRPVDIFIDREGKWHAGGIPLLPEKLSEKADMFWDTTRTDAYLSLGGLPIANVSGGLSSFPEKSRKMLREHMHKLGAGMPRHLAFPAYFPDIDGTLDHFADEKAKEVLGKFSPPWRVRPFPYAGNSEMILARTFPELVQAIKKTARKETGILAEEFISGKSGTFFSVRGFRGKDIYVFPPLGSFTAAEKESLFSFSENLHRYAGGSDYISADVTLTPKKKIYLTDLEFSPNLLEESPFALSCRSVGAEPHHVIEHILYKAVGEKH